MNRINTWYAWATRLYILNSPILYGVIFALFLIKSFFMLDPDFGWHLTSGQYIMSHGIPYHDIYSYTMPTFAWIHHEWLADIGNYLVYHYLGDYTALSVVYAAMWTASVWLLARHSKHRLLILFIVILMLPFAGVRAITWSALLSSVLIVVCRSKHPRAVYGIPLVMLLWANVHGSFVVGVAYLIWRWLENRTRRNAIIALASVLVTFITPYGAGMYVEVFRTMTDLSLHTTIAEWEPLQLSIGLGVFTGLWAAILVIGKRVSWRLFVRFESLLLLMAFSSSRHTVLFILFAIPAVLAGIESVQVPVKDIPVKRFAILLVSLLVMLSSVLIYKAFIGFSANRESTYPAGIAADLRAGACPAGNVFANYNYGGYLIWKVPGEKLFIDGRMPSWSINGQDIMANYLKITKSTTYRAEQFARYNIRCVVWDGNDALAKTLQREGWSVARVETNNSIVLLRR